ncbi:MAG: hypothetical protein CNIPEHKO_01025 [Anaerolineales bacterium]|nr:hypothetical protein [Anaerolineales bacterium]
MLEYHSPGRVGADEGGVRRWRVAGALVGRTCFFSVGAGELAGRASYIGGHPVDRGCHPVSHKHDPIFFKKRGT